MAKKFITHSIEYFDGSDDEHPENLQVNEHQIISPFTIASPVP